MPVLKCIVCGSNIEVGTPSGKRPYSYNYMACVACQAKYPSALVKACGDPYHYSLKLRDGKGPQVDFTRASIHGDWVTIYDDDNADGVVLDGNSFSRGVDINMKDIVWVADAPNS